MPRNIKVSYQGCKFCVLEILRFGGFTGSNEIDKEVTPERDATKRVAKFSYLRDVLSSGRKVREAVSARRRCEWKKFKDTTSVLCKRECC